MKKTKAKTPPCDLNPTTKKNYLIYYISLCFLCMSCQHANKTNESSINKDTLINNDTLMNKNISLKVVPNTFEVRHTADIKIVYIVSNQTSSLLQYGTRYKIEKYTGTRWEAVPFIDNLAFEDILYGLEPTRSQEFKIAIPKILKSNTIDAGLYRIVKEVWPTDRKHKKTTLTAEFTVE